MLSCTAPPTIVSDLVHVRQIISEQVADPDLRVQLLRLAGTSPQAWKGCGTNDVVAVLTAELTSQRERQRAATATGTPVAVQTQPVVQTTTAVPVVQAQPAAEAAVAPVVAAAPSPTVVAAPQPAVQYVQAAPPARTVVVAEPVYVHAPSPGLGLGKAMLTGAVAGRVAGRTAARTAMRRRRF